MIVVVIARFGGGHVDGVYVLLVVEKLRWARMLIYIVLVKRCLVIRCNYNVIVFCETPIERGQKPLDFFRYCL